MLPDIVEGGGDYTQNGTWWDLPVMESPTTLKTLYKKHPLPGMPVVDSDI